MEIVEAIAKMQKQIDEHERFQEWLYFVLKGDKGRISIAFDNPIQQAIVEVLKEKDLLDYGNA